MAGLTLDTGALIAYERGAPAIRETLSTAFSQALSVTVPAVVIAEAWRGGARGARIARLLKTCAVEPLDERLAREAGMLLAATGGANTVDACVAAGVRRRGDVLATADRDDMRALLDRSHRLIRV